MNGDTEFVTYDIVENVDFAIGKLREHVSDLEARINVLERVVVALLDVDDMRKHVWASSAGRDVTVFFSKDIPRVLAAPKAVTIRAPFEE